MQPSKDVFESSCHRLSFYPIPGWNDLVKLIHIRTRIFYLSWVKKGRPKNGEILTKIKSTRKQFKYELRRCKRLKDQKSAHALAKAFYSDTSSKAFWQNIKKFKKSSPLPAKLEVPQDPEKLRRCEKIISVTYLTLSEMMNIKSFVYNNITRKNSYTNLSQYMCDVNTIQSLMCKLPFKSTAGSDNISAEHICFADSTGALYLSLFFNMCILHDYISKPCINPFQLSGTYMAQYFI